MQLTLDVVNFKIEVGSIDGMRDQLPWMRLLKVKWVEGVFAFWFWMLDVARTSAIYVGNIQRRLFMNDLLLELRNRAQVHRLQLLFILFHMNITAEIL
jgi:hypothetical protein